MNIIIEWDNLLDDFELTDDLKAKAFTVIEKCIAEVSDVYSKDSEIDIMLVDNDEIHRINLETREIDRPTDVLSFPLNNMKDGILQEDEMFSMDPYNKCVVLGDIVISIPRCIEQAMELGHSFEREFLFLISHGTFHVLGFDHMTPSEEKVMIGMQEKVLNELGFVRT